MDRSEAARVMGMKLTEVLEVEETEAGHVVTTHDGIKTLLPDGGTMPPYVGGDDGVSAVLSPGDEPDGDEVPDGSAKDVLAWVGDDPERALQAFDVEHAKDSPRKVLLATLEKLVG